MLEMCHSEAVFIYRQRLELMREMYHNEAELSPTSPEPNIASMMGSDPFYDRFPWFRLIGRSVIFLNLAFYFYYCISF